MKLTFNFKNKNNLFKIPSSIFFDLFFSLLRLDEQYQTLDEIYDLPWNRIGPYLVGIISGYILVVKMKNKLEIERVSFFFQFSNRDVNFFLL